MEIYHLKSIKEVMLEDVYYNRKLRKELMIDFNMTWEELFETLKKISDSD